MPNAKTLIERYAAAGVPAGSRPRPSALAPSKTPEPAKPEAAKPEKMKNPEAAFLAAAICDQAVIVIEFNDGRTVRANIASFGMFSVECRAVADADQDIETGMTYVLNKHSIRRMWRAPIAQVSP